ncbi:MAG: hypothetical protein AAB510_02595 [Patescibacteria group bacterium]
MEQNFQTSFIPKKPLVRENTSATYTKPIGFLTVICILIVLTVAITTGAFYFYKGVQLKSIAKMESDLSLAKNRFEPTKIEGLRLLDRRLHAANQVLTKHIAISPIFEELQLITMKSVRFTKFSYTYGGNLGDRVNVKMSGVSLGYSHLALQSDLFGKNKNFIEPVFSNLTLSETGNIIFDLDFSVDPSFVDYKLNLLKREQAVEGILPPQLNP